MLKEIFCDQFKENDKVRPAIQLKNGLNIITGETLSQKDSGNSLGKSTFLLIIDFVFGGDSYYKKSNMPSLVSQHTIFFTFEFDGEAFYFCRKTSDKTHVYKCDDAKNITETLTLKEYTAFLAEKYHIEISDISFREFISPFFRIYKKTSNSPTEPLKDFSAEGNMEQIRKFEKIFGIYQKIKNEADIVDRKKAEDSVKTYSKKKNVSLAEFEKVSVKGVQDDIKAINEKIDELKKNQKRNFLELDRATLDKIVTLKGEIRKLKRKITIQKMKIHTTHENIGESAPITQDSFELLLQYFPNANIKKLEETEQFHKAISEILREESLNAENELQKELTSFENELQLKQDELYILSGQEDLSASYLQELVSLQTRLEKNMELLKSEEQKQNWQEQAKAAESILKETEYKLILGVQKTLNDELERISQKILGEGHITIKLDVQEKRNNSFAYSVSASPDDGTSTEYVSCLAFDIAALKNSNLPCICHDSYCISDTKGHRLTGLLNCYNEAKNKQIFISIHKENNLEKEALSVIQENTVLRLYENGGELFGRSFATKRN